MACAQEESDSGHSTLKTALESAQNVKTQYGDHCRILRQQGDYEMLIKVEFPQKVAVQVAILNTIISPSQLDIFIRNCPDSECQTKLQTALQSFINSMPSMDISRIFTFAQDWLSENWPSQSHTPPPSTSSSSSKQKKPAKPSKTPEDPPEGSPSRKPPMKTASDVISRLQWDSDLPSKHFVVGYLDRFTGIIEKPFDEFNWNDDFVDVDLESDFAVPQHRIQYFKYKTAIVWDKKERFDAIFGSGGSERASLEKIMRDEDAKEQ